MSNNSSNYQEYTFSKLLEQYDKILVPMIQRDYAQGRTDDKKAEDVRNNLLNDIFSDKDVHFDLVFGSKEKRIIDGKEMNCFIPVDGQQRLTTLFLLYLYGQKAGKTNTELDLSKFSYDTRRAASDFCKSITSEDWSVPSDKKVSDVIKDSSWFMNYWEKDPTVEGMLNMLDAIHEKCEKCKKITDYPDLDKITFFFFDLEFNGLNENLYLKMNSRGKPLTAFENLKAKMEKVLPDDIEIEEKCFPKCDASPKDSFKEKWKYFMDRNWTETFWDKEHPEKYDESITKFIVRFLSGYWAAYGDKDKEQEQKFADEIKSLNSKDSYADFIPFEPIKKVLDLEKAFSALAYAMTTVPKIEPYWTNDTIKVSDQSEYKFLAVVFTYVLFDGDKDAMRFAWNMSENYVTGYDTFAAYCKRAKEIHDKFEPNEDNAFYKILSGNGIANPSDQFKEEIAKAKQILDENGTLRRYNGSCQKADGSNYQTWEEIIIEAEKYAFFKGAIRFLFTDEKGDVNDQSWQAFDTKWPNARKYFSKEGEVNPDYQIDRVLFKKLLKSISDFNSLYEFYYDDSLDNWRSYILLNDKLAKCVDKLLTEAPEEKRDNWDNSQRRVFEDLTQKDILLHIGKGFELDIRNGFYLLTMKGRGNGQDWKRYFIGVERNSILSKLYGGDIREEAGGNKIYSSQKINYCGFFWGEHINFKYNNHFFQWYGAPNEKELDVYLMENEWADYKKQQDPQIEGQPDIINYYCFKVTKEMETDTSLFTKQLDCLIAQAYPEKSNKVCYYDCQNKVCE